MIMVSDQHPTKDEVAHFVNNVKGMRSNEVLSKKKAAKLYKAQQDLVTNYSYTKEEIDRLVEEKKKNNKIFNIGKERTIIQLAVKAAKSDVEETKQRIQMLEKRVESGQLPEKEEKLIRNNIDNLEAHLMDAVEKYESKQTEEKRIMERYEAIKKRLRNTNQVQNLSRVNQRAYSANKRADYDAYKNQRMKENEQSLDPYARRKVKPKNLWEVGQTKKDKGETPKKAKDKSSVPTSNEEKSKEVAKNNDTKEKKNDVSLSLQKSDVASQSHQFAIDEELLGKGTSIFIDTRSKIRKRRRVRKGLSLAEYQSMKMAGTL